MKYLFLFIISFSCLADEWRTEETKREAVYMALHVMDWAQTRNIARNPLTRTESNRILGQHPSVDKVDAYFVSMALVHYAVATALPDDYMSAFQYFTIGVEWVYVQHNFQVGVSVKF